MTDNKQSRNDIIKKAIMDGQIKTVFGGAIKSRPTSPRPEPPKAQVKPLEEK